MLVERIYFAVQLSLREVAKDPLAALVYYSSTE